MMLYKNVIESMTDKTVRAILIDEKIHKRTMFIFADNDLPITLMEVQGSRVFCPRLRL